MKKQLSICTFNVRNDNLIKGLTPDKILKSYEVFFRDYEIDILATQEMITSTISLLEQEFPQYTVIGHGRYGDSHIVNKLKILRKYNEQATVFTKLPVLQGKTLGLPWVPFSLKEWYQGIFKYRSVTPRILTDVVLDLENDQRIRILNTHLDCHINSVRKRQLKYVLNYVKDSTLPVVLLGDFNSHTKNKLFIDFVEQLKKFGLKRVEYNHKTYKKSRDDLPIDHIFVPKEFKIEEIGIIESEKLNGYSDHHPILVKVEIE